MDGSHYSSNVINASSASYPSSAASTPHSLPPSSLPPSGLPPHTLPPLQQSSTAMQQAYSGYPNQPRTPATPNTPGSMSSMASYPPPPTTNAGRGGYQQMMATSAYPQPPQTTYPTTSAMMPQTSGAMAHPQPIAPAPSPVGRGAPPMLRPMPQPGVMPQQGMQSPYSQSTLVPQQGMMQESDQPTHVVGSQGRRGILPSAPGRPAAPAAGTVAKNQIPQKDADGKFPCPHCTKTYLHAKHLKRHLLRHTGDRPYMCVLCRDTFSRSDILKRHFQKCSIRRGNPTGASHLSHPHAHVKKNSATKALEGDVNHMNGMGNVGQDGVVHPFGLIPAPEGMQNMQNDQSQLSRSNSINQDAAERDRRNASVMAATTRGGSFDQSYNGSVPSGMNPNINPQLANYNMPGNQNGMPMFGGQNTNQQANLDWSMFQAGAQDTYVVNNAFPPNVGQTQTAIKQEPNGAEAVPTGGVSGGPHADFHNSNPHDRSLFFGNWGPQYPEDPYQHISKQIISFLQPQIPTANPNDPSNLNYYFSPENVKDFLEKYTHFNVHFPILHIPTFRILDAYTGLLAGMCCIGACYSERVSADHVREMMDILHPAFVRDSRILASLNDSGGAQVKYEEGSFGGSARDLEELQAVLLLHTVLVWNGTPLHREKARRIFPLIALFTRKAGLLTVSKDSSPYSPLHQLGFVPRGDEASSFDWMSWVEEEKRIRLTHTIYSFDVALGLYFNAQPMFDPFEIQIPLPSDDAAWDAHSATDCAQALGLHGPDAANQRNPDGTRRAKQPEMHLALGALLHSSYQIQTGTTNLHGKFFLVHALLALIRKAQTDGQAAVMNTPGTPLVQTDWIVGGGQQDATSGVGSGNNSGRGTPVDGLVPPQTLKMLFIALDKFKRNWDIDMANQFLPSSWNPRRHGFSRDGVHYYWLARYLLKNTRPGDLTMAPDQRFAQVIHLLKSVKHWVMSDAASRGEELGSIGAIDRDYGAQKLTLDMVSLFKPLPSVVENPGTGITSVKAEIGAGTDGTM